MRIAVLLLFASILASAQSKDSKFILNTMYPATALLYSQEDNGGMKMRCTATAIDKTDTGFVFVTAAHCGCEDNTEEKTVSPEKTFFYITFDDPKEKKFNKAEVIGCGYRHRGDDFMLLTAAGDAGVTAIPLGNDPNVLDQVANVASPLGLGKQVFIGSISSSILDRPVVDGDINWTGVVLLQMFGVNGGSSGSSLVCLDQKAICAFVVGSIGQTTMTAMPVSRLKKLRAGIADGSYKYWVKDPDTVRSKTAAPEKK